MNSVHTTEDHTFIGTRCTIQRSQSNARVHAGMSSKNMHTPHGLHKLCSREEKIHLNEKIWAPHAQNNEHAPLAASTNATSPLSIFKNDGACGVRIAEPDKVLSEEIALEVITQGLCSIVDQTTQIHKNPINRDIKPYLSPTKQKRKSLTPAESAQNTCTTIASHAPKRCSPNTTKI